MIDENQGDIGKDIIRFHRIITHSIEVSIHNVNKFLEIGTIEKLDRDGFLKYIQSFSTVLYAHHVLENKKIFPYFKDKLPNAPYDQLMAQHKEVEALLSRINSGINGLKSQENELISLNILKTGLEKIDSLWHPHIQIEEEQIYGKVGNLNISTEETDRLRAEFSQFFQELATPPYLVVPFLLYNLSPEDRDILAHGFPEMVIKQLVPIDWKDKWSSMQPFLIK